MFHSNCKSSLWNPDLMYLKFVFDLCLSSTSSYLCPSIYISIYLSILSIYLSRIKNLTWWLCPWTPPQWTVCWCRLVEGVEVLGVPPCTTTKVQGWAVGLWIDKGMFLIGEGLNINLTSPRRDLTLKSYVCFFVWHKNFKDVLTGWFQNSSSSV